MNHQYHSYPDLLEKHSKQLYQSLSHNEKKSRKGGFVGRKIFRKFQNYDVLFGNGDKIERIRDFYRRSRTPMLEQIKQPRYKLYLGRLEYNEMEKKVLLTRKKTYFLSNSYTRGRYSEYHLGRFRLQKQPWFYFRKTASPKKVRQSTLKVLAVPRRSVMDRKNLFFMWLKISRRVLRQQRSIYHRLLSKKQLLSHYRQHHSQLVASKKLNSIVKFTSLRNFKRLVRTFIKPFKKRRRRLFLYQWRLVYSYSRRRGMGSKLRFYTLNKWYNWRMRRRARSLRVRRNFRFNTLLNLNVIKTFKLGLNKVSFKNFVPSMLAKKSEKYPSLSSVRNNFLINRKTRRITRYNWRCLKPKKLTKKQKQRLLIVKKNKIKFTTLNEDDIFISDSLRSKLVTNISLAPAKVYHLYSKNGFSKKALFREFKSASNIKKRRRRLFIKSINFRRKRFHMLRSRKVGFVSSLSTIKKLKNRRRRFVINPFVAKKKLTRKRRQQRRRTTLKIVNILRNGDDHFVYPPIRHGPEKRTAFFSVVKKRWVFPKIKQRRKHRRSFKPKYTFQVPSMSVKFLQLKYKFLRDWRLYYTFRKLKKRRKWLEKPLHLWRKKLTRKRRYFFRKVSRIFGFNHIRRFRLTKMARRIKYRPLKRLKKKRKAKRRRFLIRRKRIKTKRRWWAYMRSTKITKKGKNFLRNMATTIVKKIYKPKKKFRRRRRKYPVPPRFLIKNARPLRRSKGRHRRKKVSSLVLKHKKLRSLSKQRLVTKKKTKPKKKKKILSRLSTTKRKIYKKIALPVEADRLIMSGKKIKPLQLKLFRLSSTRLNNNKIDLSRKLFNMFFRAGSKQRVEKLKRHVLLFYKTKKMSYNIIYYKFFTILSTRAKRRGGISLKLPTTVRPKKSFVNTRRWLKQAIRKRNERSWWSRVEQELCNPTRSLKLRATFVKSCFTNVALL